jgi:NADH:ubiquinone oxidoreductase subunit 4 (subunit M)
VAFAVIISLISSREGSLIWLRVALIVSGGFFVKSFLIFYILFEIRLIPILLIIMR